ncbi:MAG TPA: hypothetical protein VGB73_08395 [Pyrinomonadaceae bacterium]|jgi:hypothetical protein
MSKILRLTVACFALVVTLDERASAQQADAPRFEDYRVVVWRGSVAPLKMRSHRLARSYRTIIREQRAEAGINFAGHYTFVSAGCGTGCSINGIIDARTGRAYFPRELTGWTISIGDYQLQEGEDDFRVFRSDSRLLKIVGRPNTGRMGEERQGASGVYYYEWANNRLRLLKVIRAASYPQPDQPSRR